MLNRLFAALIFLASGGATQAAGILNATVEGDALSANIWVGGAYGAEITIEFQDVVGLSVENVGLSAHLVDPNDAALTSRLPDPSLMSLVSAFPVMLEIDPPANGGLSFSGEVAIEIYTHSLNYNPAVPLRLFSAESGAQFHDVTQRVSSGSYRVRGSKGQFSEFLIVLDTRTTGAAINDKFDRLNTLLLSQQADLPGPLFNSLVSLLSQAESAADLGAFENAIDYVGAFSATVRDAVNAGLIPNVWRSSEDVTNVAGLLLAGAGTLRFSLTLASNSL